MYYSFSNLDSQITMATEIQWSIKLIAVELQLTLIMIVMGNICVN